MTGEEAEAQHAAVAQKAAEKAAEKAAAAAKKAKPREKVIRLGADRETKKLAAQVAAIEAAAGHQSSGEESTAETAPPPHKKTKTQRSSPPPRNSPRDVTPDVTPDITPATSDDPESPMPEIEASKKKKKQGVKSTKSTKRAEKQRDTLVLTEDQEHQIVDWVKNHPILYSRVTKGHECQRNNEHLWIKLAEDMQVEDFRQLMTWWETLRNRYVRLHLKEQKSGSAPLDQNLMTPKDLFAYNQCNFLHGHVRHQHQPKPTKSAVAQAARPQEAPEDLHVLADVVVPAAGGPLEEG